VNRSWVDRLLLAAAALPFLLCGLTWGLPRAVSPETVAPWGYDEVAPLQPLNEAYARFTREGSSYLAYPLFHYIVLTTVDVPYLGWQYLTGQLHPAASYPYGLSDPVSACRDLVVLNRLVAVLMAVGIVWAAYATARTLFDVRAARCAGALVCTLPLLTYYGKMTTLDVPYAFWVMLAIYCAAQVVARQARLRHYVLLGVCTALAVATKDQALGYLVLYPLLFVALRLWAAPPGEARPSLWQAAVNREHLAALAATVITFALANNLLLGAEGFRRHLQVASEMAERERAHNSDLWGQVELLSDTERMLGWVAGPSLVLAAVGLLALTRARRWGVIGLLLLPPLGHQIVVLGRVGYVYPRWLLPTAVLMILLGAGALHHVRERRLNWALRLVVVLGVIYSGAMSINLNYTLAHDARYQAEEWIGSHVTEPATFEAYTTHERTLPRCWDRHRLHLVGPEEMRSDALRQRDPDYVIVTDLGGRGDAKDPATGAYLDDLSAGRVGYREVADYETPSLLPPRLGRLISCTAPRVTIYRREDSYAARYRAGE
jgi:Dolichyl-phosphate-mannose-protein mannosyltransferase